MSTDKNKVKNLLTRMFYYTNYVRILAISFTAIIIANSPDIYYFDL